MRICRFFYDTTVHLSNVAANPPYKVDILLFKLVHIIKQKQYFDTANRKRKNPFVG